MLHHLSKLLALANKVRTGKKKAKSDIQSVLGWAEEQFSHLFLFISINAPFGLYPVKGRLPNRKWMQPTVSCMHSARWQGLRAQGKVSFHICTNTNIHTQHFTGKTPCKNLQMLEMPLQTFDPQTLGTAKNTFKRQLWRLFYVWKIFRMGDKITSVTRRNWI